LITLSTAFDSFPLDIFLAVCQYIDMVCAYCGNETKVTNSRLQKRNNQVWRRRQCLRCSAVFTTHEAIDLSQALSVDSGASTRPFLADRLFSDILAALKDHNDRYVAAREVTSTVTKNLLKNRQLPSFGPKTISKATAEVLKRFDKRAYLRFVADHESLQ
jgi:transcriptional repressor NrdR